MDIPVTLKKNMTIIYEDGDLTIRLRGGSVNCFVCHSLESDRIVLIFSGDKLER